MEEASAMVSIVLPTYNGAKYIRQSIDSCLDQTYKNIELIIVDDGSLDETPEIIKSYKDERIKYIRHKKNMSLPDALNIGFTITTGEYLTWISDDNYYTLDAIEVMLSVLENNKRIDFVYANYYKINENNEILGVTNFNPAKELYLENCIGACFLYRRKVYKEVGKFSLDLFLAEDYEYWLRVYKKFKMQKLDAVLYYYRHHESSLTNRNKSKKIEEQAQKARDKHNRFFLRYCQHGMKCYNKTNYRDAQKLSIVSILLNPFNYDAWRLLAFSTLPEKIIKVIRNFEQYFI